MATHVHTKAFAGTRGQCSIKRFLICVYFIVKMMVSTTKLDNEAFEMDNQIHYRKESNPGKLNCALRTNDKLYNFRKTMGICK